MALGARTRDWAQDAPSECQEAIFTVRVVKHWNREAVAPPSLETFGSCLDILLGNWL